MAAPICYRRLTDVKEHLREEHGVDPKEVKDGQFWQRYKIRTQDGLLQKYMARRGAVSGLERRGSSGVRNVLNTSASQGSLQSYWNSCVGSGIGTSAAWGDLVNADLYNWVHHDSETAYQEALEDAAAGVAEEAGEEPLTQSARRPPPSTTVARSIWQRYAPTDDLDAEEARVTRDDTDHDSSADPILLSSSAAWEQLTANFRGYTQDDKDFICDDDEDVMEEDEDENGQSSEGETAPAAVPAQRKKGRSSERTSGSRPSLTPQEQFLRQQAEAGTKAAASQRESMSLQDVLPHLSQQRSRDPDEFSEDDAEEDYWSGESSDAVANDDPDAFVVDDEALAEESEASDDALDRAEAKLRAERRARKSGGRSATKANTVGGRRRGAAAAAATADVGLRRSRRPSSKHSRKEEAAALVQDLQNRSHGRKQSAAAAAGSAPAAETTGSSSNGMGRVRSRTHKRRRLSSQSASGSSGSSDDDLALSSNDDEDAIESSSSADLPAASSRRRRRQRHEEQRQRGTKRHDNPRNRDRLESQGQYHESRHRRGVLRGAASSSGWKQAALQFIEEHNQADPQLSDDVSDDEDRHSSRKKRRKNRRRT